MSRAVSILIILVLAVIAALVYRSTSQPPAESAVDGLSSEVVSVSPETEEESDFQELLALVNETIDTEEWSDAVGPSRVVKTNDLIEAEPQKADYILTLDLYRGSKLIATRPRYFANHRGAEMQVPLAAYSHSACSIYNNGFLTGSASYYCKSDKRVAVTVDWGFLDGSTNLKTEFECSFDAEVDESGIVTGEEDAEIRWKFDRKRTRD